MKRKTKLWIVEGVIVVIALVGLSWVMLPKFLLAQKNLNTPIHFPDETFRECVTKALHISPSDPFMKEDCEAFTGELDCKNLGIKDLKGIEYFTQITGLNASRNEITKIDVSQNVRLRKLLLDYNHIKAIDVTHNPQIDTLGLTKNQLTELDVSNLPSVHALYCGSNQLTNLDVSKNQRLADFHCGGNQFTELDLSNQPILINFSCDGNRLTKIKFHPECRMSMFSCSRNQFTELNLSGLKNLWSLRCGRNQLNTIDISQNPRLYLVNIDRNQITDVKAFFNHPALKTVDVSNNQLDYDDWDDLQELDRQLQSKPGDDKLYKFTYSPQEGIDPFQR